VIDKNGIMENKIEESNVIEMKEVKEMDKMSDEVMYMMEKYEK
jgi:GTP1/Obg family GTP-binding protein